MSGTREHAGTCICLSPRPLWMMWETCRGSQCPLPGDTQALGWDFRKPKEEPRGEAAGQQGPV